MAAMLRDRIARMARSYNKHVLFAGSARSNSSAKTSSPG